MRILDAGLRFSAFGSERTQTKKIVIHHTAGDWNAETVETINAMHRDVNGWIGIGYHFFIAKDGNIWRGRSENWQGAHCIPENWRSLGVVVSGNFENDEPTPEQMQSLKELVLFLRIKYGLPPNAVIGHRDADSTACPGEKLYRQLGAVRAYSKPAALEPAPEVIGRLYAHDGKMCIVANGEEWELNAPVLRLPVHKRDSNPFRETTEKVIDVYAHNGRFAVKMDGRLMHVAGEMKLVVPSALPD
jgi:hypothetical protein